MLSARFGFRVGCLLFGGSRMLDSRNSMLGFRAQGSVKQRWQKFLAQLLAWKTSGKHPKPESAKMVKQNMHNPSCSCMFQSWILACCTIELPPACLMQAVAMPRMWDCPAWCPFGFLGEACGLRFLQVSRLQAGVAMPCCSLRPSLLEVSWNGTEMLQPSN